MNITKLDWYRRRLQRMSAREVGWRLTDFARQRAWAFEQVRPASPPGRAASRRGRGYLRHRPAARALKGPHRFAATLPPGALSQVPAQGRLDVIAAAEEILAGRWTVLGVTREDINEPDWFFDPVTGRRAPSADYCFDIDHRDERATGDIKQVWELSRHHHLTVLAGAFAFSREPRFAEGAAGQLRAWWRLNPFLSGVHWTSGIEVGLRLIAWAWVRRLLEGWDGAQALFEDNEEARAQIWWHQHYLANFRSRGSSANNHVIAEAAGQLVGGLAFRWFEESDGWSRQARELLQDELKKNTFPSGVNREMAFDYHGFVAELGLLAAAEAEQACHPVSPTTWRTLCGMVDVAAAVLDGENRAPRQGDSDDGRALVLGSAETNRWPSLLALGQAVFGAPDWWPATSPDAFSVLVASMAGRQPQPGRPARRPGHFDDAGLTILRSADNDGPEIWCRCDGGPHGFLSIAAHAHADALSIEVRHGGVDILADPGTYCYGREPDWRSYFKSTLGHNTVEIANRDQSRSGGPTLWIRGARTRLVNLDVDHSGNVRTWSAEHDGYASLDPPASHQRTVRLESAHRRIEIIDEIRTAGTHAIRLAFHLGPTVGAELDDQIVSLRWEGGEPNRESARLLLPGGFHWSLVRASTDPILGWYSGSFGQKEPATTVLGKGACAGSQHFKTVLQFGPSTSGADERRAGGG